MRVHERLSFRCRCSTCACESRDNQHLLTGAKEAKFPYFSKGKPVSSWLISKSSDIFLYKSSFCASNSWLAFCSLSSALLCSSLITGAVHTSYNVIRWNGFCLRQLAEVGKRCLYLFKYGYFSYKNASIRYRRPLFTPRSRVRHVNMDACVLFDFWMLNKNTCPRHSKAWKSKDNF